MHAKVGSCSTNACWLSPPGAEANCQMDKIFNRWRSLPHSLSSSLAHLSPFRPNDRKSNSSHLRSLSGRGKSIRFKAHSKWCLYYMCSLRHQLSCDVELCFTWLPQHLPKEAQLYLQLKRLAQSECTILSLSTLNLSLTILSAPKLSLDGYSRVSERWKKLVRISTAHDPLNA